VLTQQGRDVIRKFYKDNPKHVQEVNPDSPLQILAQDLSEKPIVLRKPLTNKSNTRKKG